MRLRPSSLPGGLPFWALVVFASLVLGALPPASDASDAPSLRLVAFGDTGVTSSTRANVNGSLADGAEGYLGLGDYYYWDSPSSWRATFAPLTDRGAHLALGNHDDAAVLGELMGQNATWSRVLGGARVVAINTQASMAVGGWQHAFARSELCDASEPTRVLLMHKPWWLLPGARHNGTEFPGSASAMDALVAECGVSLVLAGHEHNYQRLMRGGAAYLIVGTGGVSLYPLAGSPAGTVASYHGYGRLLLDLRADGWNASFRALDGSVKDTFASDPPTTAPAIVFTSKGGNEWWVKVAITGEDASAVSLVQGRDENSPWKTLPKDQWGNYAASFRVESGNTVLVRATLFDGRVAESCPFAHPSGARLPCPNSTPPPPPAGGFGASFHHARGNTWWIEVEVTPTNGTLAGVDGRVNAGAWVALAKKSWGSWAKSVSAPTGSLVEFRARSSEGATAISPAYRWPP